MQYIVAFNMLVNSRDSFVTAQHKNKLYKSVEKGLTYEIDTKQKKKKVQQKHIPNVAGYFYLVFKQSKYWSTEHRMTASSFELSQALVSEKNHISIPESEVIVQIYFFLKLSTHILYHMIFLILMPNIEFWPSIPRSTRHWKW